MAVTAAQIATVRRMAAEPTTDTYDDDAITAFITARAVHDERGVDPTYLDFSTTPPTVTANPNWIETYDINAATADIWDEKAAAVACDFDFSADGASYTRSQVLAGYRKTAGAYRARARVTGTELVHTQRELTPAGVTIETTPLVDRYNDDGVANT